MKEMKVYRKMMFLKKINKRMIKALMQKMRRKRMTKIKKKLKLIKMKMKIL